MERVTAKVSDANVDRAQPADKPFKTEHIGSMPPALLPEQYLDGKPLYEWRRVANPSHREIAKNQWILHSLESRAERRLRLANTK